MNPLQQHISRVSPSGLWRELFLLLSGVFSTTRKTYNLLYPQRLHPCTIWLPLPHPSELVELVVHTAGKLPCARVEDAIDPLAIAVHKSLHEAGVVDKPRLRADRSIGRCPRLPLVTLQGQQTLRETSTTCTNQNIENSRFRNFRT